MLGDFNAITSSADHKGNNFNYYTRKVYYFYNFISGNSLLNVSFSVVTFSWCNGQRGLARRWACLDRFLVNDNWLTYSTTIHPKYLPNIFSDHSPMLISIAKANIASRRIFPFENYWLEHASYIFEIHKALS